MSEHWMDDKGVVFTKGHHQQAKSGVRPVVVIDPEEDGVKAARLTALFWDRVHKAGTFIGLSQMSQDVLSDFMLCALRDLAPLPRAEVPEAGWGRNATVRDRAGVEWRLMTSGSVDGLVAGQRWLPLGATVHSTRARKWEDLDVAPDGILWAGAR